MRFDTPEAPKLSYPRSTQTFRVWFLNRLPRIPQTGAEERRLYTTLGRPMPDYALEHVFSAYGAVDFVRLQSDARHGVVQFASAEAAAAALAGLTSSDICGQVCVRTSCCWAMPTCCWNFAPALAFGGLALGRYAASYHVTM